MSIIKEIYTCEYKKCNKEIPIDKKFCYSHCEKHNYKQELTINHLEGIIEISNNCITCPDRLYPISIVDLEYVDDKGIKIIKDLDQNKKNIIVQAFKKIIDYKGE